MGYREDYFKAHPSTNGFYQCCSCGGWFKKKDIDVDHRIAKRLGGTDDIWNLQALCKHCNRSKRERSSGQEIATTIVAGAISGVTENGIQGGIGNLAGLGKSVATQKLKDAMGIKYKRK